MGYFYYPIRLGYLNYWVGSNKPDLTNMVDLGEARWSFIESNQHLIAGDYTFPQFAAYAYDVFGDGYTLNTPFPTGSFTETLLNTWRLWVPAVGLGFENLMRAIEDELLPTNNSTLVIIGPTLKRLFVCNGSDVPARCWEYNNGEVGDANTTFGSGHARFQKAFFNIGDSTNGWDFAPVVSMDVEELQKASNWGYYHRINPNVSNPEITRILTVQNTGGYAPFSDSIFEFIFGDAEPPLVPSVDPDPYAPGGYSGPGGGGGSFDLDSDTIGIPPLPTLSFAATGFTRIYNPTLAQLNNLASYLWTDQTFLNTVINQFKHLLENPMDAIISLSLLPCSIPNGAPESVKVMYLNTGVVMPPATTQFVDVDCGTYTIEEFYGSALDYNPYTKVHCYLPYIGQVTLDTDEVMGRTLNVVYRIDIVTGMCAAMILVDQNVLYQFSGHCAINMPMNSADFSGYIGAAITAGKMVAGIVAGATGNIPLAGELIGAPAPKVTSTSQTTETVKTRNPKTGRLVTQWSDTKDREVTASGASFGEMTRKAISNSVGAVMASKLTVEHAGGFTGNSGYLAVRRPYLIIERPRMCNPEEYGKYNGRPSMIYMNLSECEGYTEVQSIQFENVPATNPELAELSELLKSGVLF